MKSLKFIRGMAGASLLFLMIFATDVSTEADNPKPDIIIPSSGHEIILQPVLHVIPERSAAHPFPQRAL